MRPRHGGNAAVRLVRARIAAPTVSGWVKATRALRRLNAVDVAQLHAKIAALGWAIAMFLFTPNVLAATLGSAFIWAMTGFMLVGTLISSTGLIMAAREKETDPVLLRADLQRSLRGLGIELIGIILMIFGAGLYWVTQFVLTFGPDGDQRIALGWLAYLVAALLLTRLASVLHRRRKEALVSRTLARVNGATR